MRKVCSVEMRGEVSHPLAFAIEGELVWAEAKKWRDNEAHWRTMSLKVREARLEVSMSIEILRGALVRDES